jgi:hypothetical protein
MRASRTICARARLSRSFLCGVRADFAGGTRRADGAVEGTMKNDTLDTTLTRAGILKILSDEENAAVSTAETADHLADGDEYLDLQKLDRGVRRASGQTAKMDRVLPRKSVPAATWSKLIAHLAAHARLVPATHKSHGAH